MSTEFEEQVAQFVSSYYQLVNNNPSFVHSLYHQKAEFSWPTDYGTTVEVKTAQDVEKFFAKQSIDKFDLHSTYAQSSKRGVFLVARGRTGGSLDATNSSFVQAFNLEEIDGRLTVLNDILTIIPDGEAETKEKRIEMTKTLKVTVADAESEKEEKQIGMADTSKVTIAAGTKSGKKTKKAGTKPGEKTGEGGIRDSSKAVSTGDIVQPTLRKSRFGRNLKPSHHLDDYEQHGKPKGRPVVEEPRDKPSVVIIYDPRMLEHVQPQCPPDERCKEVPERLTYIIDQFKKDGLRSRCDFQDAEPATYAQLELVHLPGYVQFVTKLPTMSEEDEEKYVETSMYFSEDEGTKTASFIAAGSVIKACDLVAQNEYKRAFAVVRPPGHHARKDKADGYCIFNNAGIGAAHLLSKYELQRILMVDIDVHHGNGSQSMFYSSDGVLFISIHSMKLDYPSGPERGAEFIGEGDGKGYNVNIPLSGNYGDADLLYIWEHIVLPIAKEFDPSAIIISAGYDAARGDTMGGCNLTREGYATLTSMLCDIGTGRVIMVLEGGYNLKVTAQCASHCVRALLGDVDVLREKKRIVPLVSTKKIVKGVKSSMSKYWDVFKGFMQEEG